MVTQLKKALYISTSILLTNAFVFNSAAETNTAANIVDNIANIATNAVNKSESSTANTSNLTSESGSQVTLDNILATSTDASSGNQGSESEGGANQTTGSKTESDVDSKSSENVGSSTEATVTSTENSTSAKTPIVAENSKKSGFVDQGGNILIAPEGTVFPSEMEDGKFYYFSKDVDKLKDRISKGEIPQGEIIPRNPSIIPGTVSPETQPGAQIPQGQIPYTPGTVPGTVSPEAQPGAQIPQGQIPYTPGTVLGTVSPEAQPGAQIPQGQVPYTPGTVPGTVSPEAQPGAQIPQGQVPYTPGTVPGTVSPEIQPGTQIPQGQILPVTPDGNPQKPSGVINPGYDDKAQGTVIYPDDSKNQQPATAKTPDVPQDTSGKKPVMFQCYLM